MSNDHAAYHDRYIAGPDHDDGIEPHTVTLSDGRDVCFYDFDFQPGHSGSFTEPPTPAEVTIDAPFWAFSGRDLTAEELEALHDGPDYDAILAFVVGLKDAERAADIANGCDETETGDKS